MIKKEEIGWACRTHFTPATIIMLMESHTKTSVRKLKGNSLDPKPKCGHKK
jgi:hypothetical protein